jgi:hypothetical protein
VAQLLTENNARYLNRPAKKQKEFVDTKNTLLEGANEYNIWYFFQEIYIQYKLFIFQNYLFNFSTC